MKPDKLKRNQRTGLPPGAIIFTGNQKVETVHIHHLQYNEATFDDKELDNHTDIIFHQSSEDQIDWYDIRGLHDTALIDLIGKTFDVHTLVLEDIADIHQRPKFEEYDNGIFIVIRALSFDPNKLKVKTEQVSLFFKKGFLISFQETESDLFEAVRKRIQNGVGKVRSRGADYLCYALLDNITDHYYIVLDEIEDMVEILEDELLSDPNDAIKAKIHHLKKELITIRKSVFPLREAISMFMKSDSEFIDERSTIFIGDLYDHTVQTIEMVDTSRDMLNGLQDLYISEISLKMNQVMQVLTIITTIFVPLSFLAGLYGMNFDNMPELHIRYGYFILLGVMLIIFVGSLLYFRKKKWF